VVNIEVVSRASAGYRNGVARLTDSRLAGGSMPWRLLTVIQHRGLGLL
jgi:hypothetical protein